VSLRFLFNTEGLMVPIDKVHQHPENDNNGDVDEIVNSMLVTGVYRPIYASRATGNIVAGNHTYLAMLDLGAKFVPVVWLDLDQHQGRRVLVADNKIARNARPDPALTADLLHRLMEVDREIALVGTGFTIEEAEALLAPPAPLDFSGLRRGRETLEHSIECPECGHRWTRGEG